MRQISTVLIFNKQFIQSILFIDDLLHMRPPSLESNTYTNHKERHKKHSETISVCENSRSRFVDLVKSKRNLITTMYIHSPRKKNKRDKTKTGLEKFIKWESKTWKLR